MQSKFTYEVMDDYGRWRRATTEYDDAKAAVEGMAEFVAHAFSRGKMVAVRLTRK